MITILLEWPMFASLDTGTLLNTDNLLCSTMFWMIIHVRLFRNLSQCRAIYTCMVWCLTNPLKPSVCSVYQQKC